VTAASTKSIYVIELIEPASEACPATVGTANVGVGSKGIVESVVFKIKGLRRAEGIRACPRIVSPISDTLPRAITQVQKTKIINRRRHITDCVVISYSKHIGHICYRGVGQIKVFPTRGKDQIVQS
jgi:hypothetical protein